MITPTAATPNELAPCSSTLSPESFARIANYITGELGIKMPVAKLTMVQNRLLRRVRELRLESVDAYTEYFFSSANTEEREHLINVITTNKTDFFREPEHFDFLTDTVLPDWFGQWRYRLARFKAWSAGCSSGEEPYTLAMVLAEFAASRFGFEFAILATDVSTKVLNNAAAGIYGEDRVLPVAPELRRKYLLSGRDGNRSKVRIVPYLRERISFHQLNFMDSAYRIKDVFDVILFRNVMIYFDRPTQEAVVNRLCRHLAPGGYLLTGHSETLAGLDVPLKLVRAAVYRKLA